MSRTFEAQRSGPCANESCNGIKAGDTVFYGSSESTVPQHLPGKCDYTDALAAKRPMCPQCLMELLPSGTCPNGCDD